MCKVVNSQRVLEKRFSAPFIHFSDIIRTRSPLSCSSTRISSHTLMLIKTEKGTMNYPTYPHKNLCTIELLSKDNKNSNNNNNNNNNNNDEN